MDRALLQVVVAVGLAAVAVLDAAIGGAHLIGVQVAWPLLVAGVLEVRRVAVVGAAATSLAFGIGATDANWPGAGHVFAAAFVATGAVVAGVIARRRQGRSPQAVDVDAKLREAEHNYRLLVEGVEDHAFFFVGGDGTIRSWNAGAERLFGYRPEHILGRNCTVLYPEEVAKSDAPDQQLERGDEFGASGLQTWHQRADGSTFWGTEVVNAVRGASGQVEAYVKLVRDASVERAALEAAEAARRSLAHQASHDVLTKLPNRSLLLGRLQSLLARRKPRPLGLLYVDLDNFKVVNDSLGHDAGDQLLIEAGGRISAAVRPEDTVARIGGDEFVVLCEEVDHASALTIADRVLSVLRVPFQLDHRELSLSASIGVAVVGTEGGDARDLLRDGDAAMYVAKARGRNRAVLFDAAVRERAVARLEIESGIRRAIANDELALYFQPVYDLNDGRLLGVEALVRWVHPERGLLAPGEWIDVAEETDLVIPLGEWVLSRAAAQARSWVSARNGAGLTVWVNISARHLAAEDFAAHVAGVLEVHGLDPGHLGVEITERALLEPRAIAALDELSRLGVPIAVDDFGTGYSSLSELRRYRIEVLKIDRRFVVGLPASSDDRAIVDAVISLAHALGARASAEGVETDQQRDALCTLGCDTACGYLLARPAPACKIDVTEAMSKACP